MSCANMGCTCDQERERNTRKTRRAGDTRMDRNHVFENLRLVFGRFSRLCRRRNGFGPFRRFRIGDSRWSRTHVLSTTILLRMLRGVAKGLGLQVGLLIPMPLALPVCSIQATVACVLGLASITSPVPCQSMRCQTVREVLLLREHTARRWRSPQS